MKPVSSLPRTLIYTALSALLTLATASAQLEQIWGIGFDNSSQAEFELENDADDFYYVENGDYTGSIPAGANWSGGEEPWNDGVTGNVTGFPRAFTEFSTQTHVFFQLDAAEAAAATNFQFDIEFIQAAPASTHDIEVRMNGNVIASLTAIAADGLNEVPLTGNFTGAAASATAGSNVITIERTGGAGGGYIQIDYLKLQSDATPPCADPICSFAGGPPSVPAGGTATLRWVAAPGATLAIDNGVGNVDADTVNGIGSIDVTPTENTTYTLTSDDGGNIDTATVTIAVSNINSFTATPFQVLPNANVVLAWDVDPSASVSIDQGIGDVNADTTDGIGSITLNPTATTTYTLTSERGADIEMVSVTVVVNTFTQLWMIGNDDGTQDEFEIEAQGDDFFYLEDGDYTGLTPAGAIWNSGPEPWSVPGDELLGFERALTEGDPDVNIYFQLNKGQANSGTTLQFNAEFADAEGGSIHDLEFRMNGTTFHTETGVIADGATEVLVSPVFNAGDVNAAEGPNVLTVARTGGTGGWIQFDYVELKADLSTAACEDPICSFATTATVINPGQSANLAWATNPTATVSIDQGIGNVDAQTTNGIGSTPISPTQNTTYTMTSTAGADTGTESVTITVRNIISFTSTPLVARPETPVMLVWQVDPSASVSIDNAIGNVDAETTDGIGGIEVTPTEPTTYTLTSTRGADVETATVFVDYSDLTTLWLIGEDNNGQAEFESEHETDEFYYWEDGDYTTTSYDGGTNFGEIWNSGQEPWNDATANNGLGFRRAYSSGVPNSHIFFQLAPEEATPASQFRFNVEFRDAEAGSIHDMEFRVNGNSFHTETGISAPGNTEVLVSDTFTGEEVNVQAGSNVLTIEHVAGDSGWIQIDYVSLEVEAVERRAFKIIQIDYLDGSNQISLEWNSLPGRLYRINSSSDLKNWENEVADSLPSGGMTTTFTGQAFPAGAPRLYFRVQEQPQN